ncbi:MAG: hypothetical protein JO111_01125 [Caulobacteraceae bacterium]|nr:hypothetical protein [Caulobacteraceae bacterium]
MPELRRARAALLHMQDPPGWRAQSDVLLEQALKRSVAQGSLAWELRIRTDQARLWVTDGLRGKAEETLQAILSRYPSTNTIDRVAAERVLEDGRGR